MGAHPGTSRAKSCSPALAHCRVTDLNLEPAISRQNELRQSANAQVVRDLRTLTVHDSFTSC